MSCPRIYLIGPAGSCGKFFEQIGDNSAVRFLERVQKIVGTSFEITGDLKLLDAKEDELNGGRQDDYVRASDIEMELGSDDTIAIIAIRGGAWFTRVLPKIDFTVLDRRTRPILVFGFSELTTLVNIVADHPMGRGIYDTGPAFLKYGLKRYAETRLGLKSEAAQGASNDGNSATTSDEWMNARLAGEMETYFRDTVSIISGHGTTREITAREIHPTVLCNHEKPESLPERFEASIVGGNLVVLCTLLGSRWRNCVDPTDRWLVLEDLNEKPERLDRFLSQLTLAGFWNRCRGLLLGDFHKEEQTLTDAVLGILKYHLPSDREVPILVTSDIGHIWPVSPLLLNKPISFRRKDSDQWILSWDHAQLDSELGR
ncbi:MAG: LD-carboxypeptidase [Planctomycetota bacterium]